MHFPSLFLAVAAVVPSAQQPAASDARADFEKAAAALTKLDYGEVLYGRIDPELWGGDAVLAELLARDDPVEQVTALLEHAEPRVRTLALAELYDREEPRLLPSIAALASDAAVSFSEPMPIHRRAGDTQPDPLEPRTVGWWARAICVHYQHVAGVPNSFDGAKLHRFDEYWAERKDRASCVSWFAVKLQRAYGAGSPIREASFARIRAVRAQIDALPPLERNVTLLCLKNDWEYGLGGLEGVFATEAECVAAARELGREKLLAFLRCEPPLDDPDLRVRTDWQPQFAGLLYFVLRHAPQLFEADDARLLLELQPWGRDESVKLTPCAVDSAWWWIAAAELQPANAQLLLETAYERRPKGRFTRAENRAELLSARWRLCPTADDAWALERFYAETLENDTSPARVIWIQALAKDGSARARATLAALVRHSSFANIDAGTLLAFVEAIDLWTGKKLIDDFERQRLQHPHGQLTSPQKWAIATAEYPLQTREYANRLEEWRARVKSSVERWITGSK